MRLTPIALAVAQAYGRQKLVMHASHQRAREANAYQRHRHGFRWRNPVPEDADGLE